MSPGLSRSCGCACPARAGGRRATAALGRGPTEAKHSGAVARSPVALRCYAEPDSSSSEPPHSSVPTYELAPGWTPFSGGGRWMQRASCGVTLDTEQDPHGLPAHEVTVSHAIRWYG